jgi:biopolymer transport protein ExbB
MSSLFDWYRAGGIAMHLVLILVLLGVGVFIERFYVIVIRSRISGRTFIERTIQLVRADKTEDAIRLCARSKAALADIGLLILRGRTHDEGELRTVTAAASKAVIPRLTRRLNYVHSLAATVVIAGVLGTVIQLGAAFAAAQMGDGESGSFAWGRIATSLNPLELGLAGAVMLRLGDAYLESQAGMIIEQLEELSMRLMNALTDRPDVRLGHR